MLLLSYPNASPFSRGQAYRVSKRSVQTRFPLKECGNDRFGTINGAPVKTKEMHSICHIKVLFIVITINKTLFSKKKCDFPQFFIAW